jgi:dihydroorotate dehydrogenase
LSFWVRSFLWLNDRLYRAMTRLLFRVSAQEAHEKLLRLVQFADSSSLLCAIAAAIHRFSFHHQSVMAGAVQVDQAPILAAGFVKGYGYPSEQEACQAVERGENIIPGWKSIPALLGLVEFGSFTRYPRPGNAGTVLWRNPQTHSTQNRIGLKNPGVLAAARFLSNNRSHLPARYGINIAISPGLNDISLEEQDVAEAITIVLNHGLLPSWLTLNLSCPNTEDDPSGNQTDHKTRRLCQVALAALQGSGIPLWVKIGPDLSDQQVHILMNVFTELGVSAVVATNTIGMPTPDGTQTAGVAGGSLHPHSVSTVRALRQAQKDQNSSVDIIACGGIIDGKSWLDFKALGISAFQYYSALIYRGPLAPAIIESEIQ